MSETHTWPDLAIELYDKLTGRGAEITYNFANLEVCAPSSTQADSAQARGKLNGTIVVSSRDIK